jgi:hypothetical protein
LFAVNDTVLLKTPRRYPAEAGGWPLNAARDFVAALDFLSKEAKCRTNTAEHMGCLLGAVIAYARPFTASANLTFHHHPDRRQCFMELAADLGADTRVHCAVLLAREDLIASSDSWESPSGRSLGAQRSMRRFVYPNPRVARIMSRIDLRDFRRIAILMRLACIFFLAEVLPVGEF